MARRETAMSPLLTRRGMLTASASAAVLHALPLRAQQPLDVPYVTTPQNVVDAMLTLAQVGAGDYLIDLGCGDGRILITAAKRFGTHGFGVDLDSATVSNAKREAARAGVTDRVSFAADNLFYTDISRATVVTLYLLPQINVQLRPLLFKQLRPGARIVSHDFGMDDWQPDQQVSVSVPDKPYGEPRSAVLLWVMPANAAGRWRWVMEGSAREVVIEQTFQKIAVQPSAGMAGTKAEGASLRGDALTVTLAGNQASKARSVFTGKVDGDIIRGRVRTTGEGAAERDEPWEARRVQRGEIQFTVTGAASPA